MPCTDISYLSLTKENNVQHKNNPTIQGKKTQFDSLLFTYIDHYQKKQTVINGKILCILVVIQINTTTM